MALAWSFRFTHWSMRTGIVSPEQVAFLPGHSAEMHVFSITQMLRSRARGDLTTYALFVDFWKAYNRVHLPSLWFIMRKMGVPDVVVGIFEDWTGKMQTRIRVNGALSEPYPMSAGCPQGWPLSCIFYIFFIEPLIHYIKANVEIRGVVVPGMTRALKALFFADDGLGLGPELSDVEAFLKAVVVYATDWGVTVNDKPGKSEAALFSPRNPSLASAIPAITVAAATCAGGRLRDAPLPPGSDSLASTSPPPPAPTLIVSFADMYTYLGLVLPTDLSHGPATAKVVRVLDCLYSRFFSYNRVVQRSCPALQLQLLGSIVVGAVVYLRSLVIMEAALSTKIDRRITRYARDIFGFPRCTPTSVVAATGMLNCMAGIIAQQRERLCMQLRNPIDPSNIAAMVFTAMLNEGPAVPNRLANMPVRARAERDKYTALGVAPPDPSPPPYMTSAESAMYSWRIAAHEWQRESRVAAGVRSPPSLVGARRRSSLAPAAGPVFSRPPPQPSAHAAAIYFNFVLRPPAAIAGPHLASFSVISPDGSSSIPALCGLRRSVVCSVARLRTGVCALRLWPWRVYPPRTPGLSEPHAEPVDPPEHVHGSHDSDSDGSEDSDDSDGPPVPAVVAAPSIATPSVTKESFYAVARPCRHCASDAMLAPEDPYHAFFECTSGAFPELRVAFAADVKNFLQRLFTQFLRCLRKA